MEFLLNEELQEFSQILSKFFAQSFNSTFIRKRLLDSGNTRSAGLDHEEQQFWQELSALGALSAGLPESVGGLGFGLVAAETIVKQAGTVLATLPVFETLALGAFPLLELATDAGTNKYLLQISTGQTKWTGAFNEKFNLLADSCVTAHAGAAQGNYTLDGIVNLVPSITCADNLLVPAVLSGNQCLLFMVELAPQVGKTMQVKAQQTFDLLRTYSKVEFKNTQAALLSKQPLPAFAWERALNTISLLAAAELIGVGAKVLNLTLEHVKTRQQFGRPIGSFQAISHKLADMKVSLASAESLVAFAAWAATNSPEQFNLACLAAKGYASENVPALIETGLQAHGGIAFTYEYDLHLYLRRAQILAKLYRSDSNAYRHVCEATCLETAGTQVHHK